MAVAVQSLPLLPIPAADRAALSGLSDDAVRKWVVARAEEYRNFALALLSVYNAVAPIHRAFPTEILSEVFSHCWQDTHFMAVAHVCRHWRAIALKTPRLWSAAITAPDKLTSARSFNPHAPFQSRIDFASDFANALTPHVARLVDLYVRLSDAYRLDCLCRFLAAGAPTLETLGITFRGCVGMYEDWLPPDPKHDDGGDSPSDRIHIRECLALGLKRWSTSAQSPTTGTPRLHTLRCIPVDLLPYFSCPTLRDVCVTPAQFNSDHITGFLNTLAQCPALVQLKFWMIGEDVTCHRNWIDWGDYSDEEEEEEEEEEDPVQSFFPQSDSPLWEADDAVDMPALRTVVANVGTFLDSLWYIYSFDNAPLPVFKLELLAKNAQLQELVDYVAVSERIQHADTVRICHHSSDPWSAEAEFATFRDGAALLRVLTSGPLSEPRATPDYAAVLRKHGESITRLELAGPGITLSANELSRRCADAALLCPRLASVAVSFSPRWSGQRPSHGAMSDGPAEWEHEVATWVQVDRSWLVKVLSDFAARGLRLKRLDWRVCEWDEVLGEEFSPTAVVRTHMLSPSLFDQTELERLVDGPVVFGGVIYQESPPR